MNNGALYCTYTGYVLKLWNAFQSASSVKRFTLEVNNVMNPFPAKVYEPFSVVIYKSDGSIL